MRPKTFSVFALLFLSLCGWGQSIEVTPFLQQNQALLAELLSNGSCVVSNIQYIGNPEASGFFEDGQSNFPMEDGILLSTGLAINAEGPNNIGSKSYNNGGAGFPLLQSLYSNASYDAAILAFDLVPCDTIYSLSLIFGSEEYLEYVNSGYTDACGIFVSGPNPNGTYYQNTNFAFVQDTMFPIDINSVNNFVNSSLFVNNGNGSTPSNEAVQYDGYTTVLTIDIPMIVGETYHVVIGVSDFGDSGLDSGIFFKGNKAPNAGKLNVSLESPYGSSTELIEGYPAWLHFEKTDSSYLSDQILVNLHFGSGSMYAIPGVDYQTVPSTITMPAGSMDFNLPLNIYADVFYEPYEWLYIEVLDTTLCGNTSFEAQVLDEFVFAAGINPGSYSSCQGDGMILTTFVNATDSMVSYQWSDGSTDDHLYFPAGTISGDMYSVTISHADGFSVVDSVQVAVSTPTVITPYSSTNLCTLNSIYIDVDGGISPYSYLWVDGSTESSIYEVLDGTYAVTVTDAVGCENVFSVPFDGATPTQANLVAQAYCDASLGEITGFASGAYSPYAFIWNTGETTAIIDSVPMGDYYVTVTDLYGCEAVDSILNFDPMPFDGQIGYSPTGCLPQLAAFQVSGGNTPYNYTWADGSTTSFINITQAGEYAATVSDATSCFIIDTILVLEDTTANLEVVANIQLDSCYSYPGTVELSALSGQGPYSYLWSNGETSWLADSLSAGAYTVTVTDANSCYQVLAVEIPSYHIHYNPNVSPITNCNTMDNGSASIEMEPGLLPVSIQWSNGSTNTTISNLGAGMYSYTISNTCVSIADSVLIEYQFPGFSSILTTNAHCNDSTGTLKVINFNADVIDSISLQHNTNGSFYSIDSTNTFNFLPEGEYTFYMQDSIGCTSSQLASIEYYPSMLNVSIDTPMCEGYPVLGSAEFAVPGFVPTSSNYNIEVLPLMEQASTNPTSCNILYDDYYSGPFPIGFEFSFFDSTYNSFYVGSNGWISFSPLFTPHQDTWLTEAIPNPDPHRPRNAILGLYRDLLPGWPHHISYSLEGTAPLRKLVVNFDSIPLFYCSYFNSTFQIVLHESTHIIDVNLIECPTCPTWNNGNGVSGIQNADGTIAYVLDSLNNKPFEAYDYTLRYEPESMIQPAWFDPLGNFLGSGTQAFFDANMEGTYTCQAQTECGFEIIETDVEYYHNIDINFNDESILCPNENLTLNLPDDLVGTWSDGTIDSVLHVVNPGEYSVIISLENGNCNWFDTTNVIMEMYENYPSVDTTVCLGDTLTVDGNIDYAYEWSNGSTSNYIQATQPSMFYLTVTSDNCTVPDSIDLNSGFYSPPISELPEDTVTCPNEGVLVYGGFSTSYSYQWSNGNTNNGAILQSLGLHHLTITDENTCQTIDSILVTEQPSALASFSFTEAFNQVLFQNTSQNTYWYEWDFGDGSSLSTDENPIYTYPIQSENSWFTAMLVAGNQCGSDTSYMNILIFDIDEENSESQLQISPNPNNGHFILSGSLGGSEEITLRVYNSTGQGIFEKPLSSLKDIDEEIDLGQIAPGVYFLKAESKNESKAWKMLVR